MAPNTTATDDAQTTILRGTYDRHGYHAIEDGFEDGYRVELVYASPYSGTEVTVEGVASDVHATSFTLELDDGREWGVFGESIRTTENSRRASGKTEAKNGRPVGYVRTLRVYEEAIRTDGGTDEDADEFRFGCDECGFASGDKAEAVHHTEQSSHRVVDVRTGKAVGTGADPSTFVDGVALSDLARDSDRGAYSVETPVPDEDVVEFVVQFETPVTAADLRDTFQDLADAAGDAVDEDEEDDPRTDGGDPVANAAAFEDALQSFVKRAIRDGVHPSDASTVLFAEANRIAGSMWSPERDDTEILP